jgi:hypothetical protein
MKMLKQMLLLSLVLVSFQSRASLLIEPHVAYQFAGKVENSSPESTFSGTQYGARLGLQTFGLMGGLDYTRSSVTIKTVGSADDKSDRDQIGVFIGYKFPILLRAWGSYYFNDKNTYSNNDYASGSGTEIGIGFTGLPFISVNLTYRTSSYDTAYDASTGIKGTLSPSTKANEIALGVSLPLNL